MIRALLLACVLSALLLPALALDDAPSDPVMIAAKAATDAGDLRQAAALYEQAAARGLAGAMVQLARLNIEGGVGLAPDYAAAMSWAQRAADAGEARGNLYLGQIWMKGLGVPADAAKALGYFHLADEGGDMKAARYIGLIAQARGETAAAARWFEKGAEAGDITSQYYLGRAFETGAGVPQDYARAMDWYRTSATRGDIIASDGMVGMAGLYERGDGVPRNMERAL